MPLPFAGRRGGLGCCRRWIGAEAGRFEEGGCGRVSSSSLGSCHQFVGAALTQCYRVFAIECALGWLSRSTCPGLRPGPAGRSRTRSARVIEMIPALTAVWWARESVVCSYWVRLGYDFGLLGVDT